MKKEFTFNKKHPIIFNLVLIILTFFVICYCALFAADIFTEHGKMQEVPDVKGKSIAEAVAIIESQGLKWTISDSIYNKNFQPGCVIEQSPKGTSLVKSKRTIYLTVSPFNPRAAIFPRVKDMSQRQGESVLKGLGFTNVSIQTTPSRYVWLIVGVTVNGKEVEPGTKVPVSSKITLMVGEAEVATDSISSDDEGGEIIDESLI